MGLFISLLINCTKDPSTNILVDPAASQMEFKSSANQVVLTQQQDSAYVVKFSFKTLDYGVPLVATHVLQFILASDTAKTDGWAKAIEVKLASDSLSKAFLGTDFNSLLARQLNLPTGTNSLIAVRLKSDIYQNSGASSSVKSVASTILMTVNPYLAIVEFPALLVKGGNSWKTPDVRTNGYLLTSAKFDAKYEGYLNLPNADGWNGDAFTLISTKSNVSYGWGTDANTLSVGGGNLWLSPSPKYMKVNVDLDALTIKYIATTFSVTGDDNGWNTAATPMTFDATTNTWVAHNVSLTAGKTFVFTCNGGYDISYKVDADGNLIFAGAPGWAGNNIPVKTSGVYTVTLDLSGGDGTYKYSLK